MPKKVWLFSQPDADRSDIRDPSMQVMVRVLYLWKQTNQAFLGDVVPQKNIRQGLKIKMAEPAMAKGQNTPIVVRGKLPHPQALEKFIQFLQFSKVTRFYLPKRDVSGF